MCGAVCARLCADEQVKPHFHSCVDMTIAYTGADGAHRRPDRSVSSSNLLPLCLSRLLATRPTCFARPHLIRNFADAS